jgi:hypothetical protein
MAKWNTKCYIQETSERIAVMMDQVPSQGMPPEAMPPVGVGDPAPDVTVAGANGQPVHLADFWRDRPVVLVFSRHLG